MIQVGRVCPRIPTAEARGPEPDLLRLNMAMARNGWMIGWMTLTSLTGKNPSGKRLHSYGKSPFGIAKSTVNEPFSIATLT